MVNALKRFWDDEEGSITLEFVLWLPLLLFWVMFSLGVFLAMDSRSDAAKATYTVADIISRAQSLDRTFIDNLRVLTDELLPGAGAAQMRVTSIIMTSTGHQVQWVECFGGVEVMEDANIPINAIPTMSNLDTVILVETNVPYIPIANVRIDGPLNWYNSVVIRPRFSAAITKQDPQISTDCAPAT